LWTVYGECHALASSRARICLAMVRRSPVLLRALRYSSLLGLRTTSRLSASMVSCRKPSRANGVIAMSTKTRAIFVVRPTGHPELRHAVGIEAGRRFYVSKQHYSRAAALADEPCAAVPTAPLSRKFATRWQRSVDNWFALIARQLSRRGRGSVLLVLLVMRIIRQRRHGQ
jgi:hypothetical protein